MGKIIGIVFIGIIAIIIIFFIFTEGPRLLFTGFQGFDYETTDAKNTTNEKGSLDEQALLRFGLQTNTTQSTIPLTSIVTGGPIKDEIPAIFEPAFISVENALKIENENGLGISVTNNAVAKFYPYSIMTWHEVVNDNFNGSPVLVTYCPLAGSAIAFNPVVQNELRTFGVSGLLWESNLLMYDTKNENIWSQIGNEAVVGVDAGAKLTHIDSQVISLSTFAALYPNGEVLSRPTNSNRDYNLNPYGDYATNSALIFSPSTLDARLPNKTTMYVIDTANNSIAFKKDDLLAQKNVSIKANNVTYTANVTDTIITVSDSNGNKFPGYTTFWFAWATQHQDDGVVWTK